MKIKVNKFVDNESLSWEVRFRRLLAHHEEETKWLIAAYDALRRATPNTCEVEIALKDFGQL